MKTFKILISLILFSATSFAQDGLIWKLDFQNTGLGPLLNYELTKEGGDMEYIYLANNSFVVDDEERPNALRVRYPEGAVGPQTIGFSGSQFIKTIPDSDDYYLDYYVKFEDGFDFQKGGKLPGLTSGGSQWTGGQHPDNGEGWSARYMWVDNGRMVVYLYYVDMPGAYGEPIEFNMNFVPGKWYRLTQRIKLNDVYTAGNGNGILQVWVDGVQVIDRDNFRFRFEGKGLIDSFYFSTFFGGATADWAPDVDSFTRFDRIRVTTEKPDFSDPGLSNDKIEKQTLSIYPNPVVDGEFTVSTVGMNKSIEMSVFSITGRLVSKQLLESSGNKVQVNINLDRGFYIVRFNDGEVVKTQKITIQ